MHGALAGGVSCTLGVHNACAGLAEVRLVRLVCKGHVLYAGLVEVCMGCVSYVAAAAGCVWGESRMHACSVGRCAYGACLVLGW